MSLDTAIEIPCAPRSYFGEEETVEGTRSILELLRARGRADAAEQLATQEGRDTGDLKISVAENYGGEAAEGEVSVGELRALAAPLETQEAACSSCPANLLGQPYGCFVTLHYPVPRSGEQWLIERVEQPGSAGWNSCLLFLGDSEIDGSTSKAMRSRGFFESKTTLRRRHRIGLFKHETVSTDQLFDLFLRDGEGLLKPPVCALILFWLGCISVEGTVPGRVPNDKSLQIFEGLLTAPTEERRARTRFLLGTDDCDKAAGELRAVLASLYRCWILDAYFYHWG
jgi:hypothetical protein